MKKEIWNIEASISIDKKSETPFYIQLYEQIKAYILDGVITEDYRLLPIRSLASILDVNNVTVINAYKLLEEEKLIYKKTGSGTYVMPTNELILWKNEGPQIFDESEYDLEKTANDKILNFTSGTLESKLFPIKDFKKVIDEVLERDGGEAFTYQDSKGYKPLRTALADYVKKINIEVDAEDIYIISGAQQGIDIISKALLTNGDYVFVESPTYLGALGAFKSRGAKIMEFPLLSDGPDLIELEKMLKLIKPKFIYTMPNFQNPTSCTYSERKKKHILLLCKKYDVMLVEDDYLSDFSYTSKNAVPLKAFDKDNRVIYIKSFSKIFMPGLRVAYLIIPNKLKEKVMSAKYVSDISTSGLMQRVLEIYLKSNLWDKQIEYMKQQYSIRYLEAVRSVKKYLRGANFNQPMGGINLWIELPSGINGNELAEKSKKKNVLITPGNMFLMSSRGESFIRLSFAGIEPEKIAEGVAIIGQTMEDMKL